MVPLGYLYVASALRAGGADVSIIIASGTPQTQFDTIRRRLDDIAPRLVVTGTSYKLHNNCPSPTTEAALEVTRIAKALRPECTTLLIGPLNIVLEDALLSASTVDALGLGEAEEICVAVSRVLAEGRELESVPGLSVRKNGRPTRTGTTDYPDLEKLPFPEREGIDFERYIRNTYFARRTTEMLTSRGCPFDCTYCFGARTSKRHDNNTGKYHRAVSPERVVEEIDLLYHRWGVRGIKFADVEFCVSKARVAKMCECMLRNGYKGLRWRAVTRATSVEPELLTLMHRAGCRHIYYGVESGDAACLEAMRKQVSLDEIRQVFRDTKKAGIHPEASFLLGVPGETEETAERTIRFACELNAFASTFHVFVPFPGIPLQSSLGSSGKLQLDDWSVYQLNVAKSYCDIPVDRLDWLSKHAYRRFYLRPRYLMGMARQLANPHMLRFAVAIALGRDEGGLLRNMLSGTKKKIGLPS